METLKERIKRIVQEEIFIVPYDPEWPRIFEDEKKHLLACLPHDLVGRIEHFGSTAIPNLSAKPIVDMLVEVSSLVKTQKIIVPILTAQKYEYFWRPMWSENIPPFYAWFIKRDMQGHRTHHIHMVEHDFEHWDRLLFRDYLIEHPDIAREYEMLKSRMAKVFSKNREEYTNAKAEFIVKTTQTAKEHYRLRSS